MILKIIGCILLVGSTSAVGFRLSHNLIVRRDFLKEFIVFISSLSTNIRYNSSDIFTLINLCVNSKSLEFLKFSERSLGSFDSEWKSKIDCMPKSISLTKADKQLLYEFGLQLGKTDIDGQLKHLELYKIRFSNRLELAEQAIVQKSKLYKTMGFFAGTAAALMMI